ncbi:hypothetical protein [Candidatus Nitrotoga sp. M5]|uniref:hypothetical protein n=1 Tax=Candidatus Nitrotoga sp. M5 TaxID=2890409 RepID=UPI001EF1F5DD|nr:hypothetical protein [Candidatus Nitrotoga sp. M5]
MKIITAILEFSAMTKILEYLVQPVLAPPRALAQTYDCLSQPDTVLASFNPLHHWTDICTWASFV